MDLAPDTWYVFADLFDSPVVELRDGSRIRGAGRTFLGAGLQAMTMWVAAKRDELSGDRSPVGFEPLQLTLQRVERHDVDGLSGRFTPMLLLKENILHISGASYAYDARVRAGGQTCRSKGAVCIGLSLDDEPGPLRNLAGKHREVETAFRRGLLDDVRRTRANFKLGVKPMQRKIQALFDAQYVPEEEWQVDILFVHWHDERTGELVASPLEGVAPGAEPSLQFTERARVPGFRITDLFAAHR